MPRGVPQHTGGVEPVTKSYGATPDDLHDGVMKFGYRSKDEIATDREPGSRGSVTG
jgi:hypothetical protein